MLLNDSIIVILSITVGSRMELVAEWIVMTKLTESNDLYVVNIYAILSFL